MRSLTSQRIREMMLANHDVAATANLKQSWRRLAPTLLREWAPNTACLLEAFAELALVTLLLTLESDDSEDSDDSSWWLQEKSCLWAFGFENSGKHWSWSTSSASSSSSSVTWKQQLGQSHHKNSIACFWPRHFWPLLTALLTNSDSSSKKEEPTQLCSSCFGITKQFWWSGAALNLQKKTSAIVP